MHPDFVKSGSFFRIDMVRRDEVFSRCENEQWTVAQIASSASGVVHFWIASAPRRNDSATMELSPCGIAPSAHSNWGNKNSQTMRLNRAKKIADPARRRMGGKFVRMYELLLRTP
jgi:hypothetical protein